ncbi:unnamed protein product [Mesocestoides corti]|uniref:PDZ domain-containing protein n=2 Tax=Mesocestoides corti TaxID=53468 RepID=A0A0R3U5S1_MESCO|nr:unnamed protein product [Mesocestoides corti]
MWTSPTNCNSPPVGVFELRNPHQRAIRVCAEAIITSEDLWLSSPLSRGKKGHERQLLLIQALRYPRGNVAVTEVEEGGSGGGGSSTNFTSEQLDDSKQRNHRSTEMLSRASANPPESRSTTPAAPRRRLHRSVSREGRVHSWRGWIRLVKPNCGDSFGIGLSEGMHSRGIYVSAIRPGSIADTSGLLQIYDRIVKVNDVSTKNRTCREVVSLIRRSSPVLDLFIHRRRDNAALAGEEEVENSDNEKLEKEEEEEEEREEEIAKFVGLNVVIFASRSHAPR